jgi:hypothetical protein
MRPRPVTAVYASSTLAKAGGKKENGTYGRAQGGGAHSSCKTGDLKGNLGKFKDLLRGVKFPNTINDDM